MKKKASLKRRRERLEDYLSFMEWKMKRKLERITIGLERLERV